jgi:hypothetical protein
MMIVGARGDGSGAVRAGNAGRLSFPSPLRNNVEADDLPTRLGQVAGHRTP